MIVARGMGNECGLASYGLGRFATVIIILPNRIFMSALSVIPDIEVDTEHPLILAVLLYPFLTAVFIIPSIEAETLEFDMSAETQQPIATGHIIKPSISAVVIQPSSTGVGS